MSNQPRQDARIHGRVAEPQLVKKSQRSKSYKVRDSWDPAETNYHVTDTHTRTRVSAPTPTRQTVSTSQWTLMLPISPHLLRNLPTKSEHNTEPRDGALGAEPKATWLAIVRKTLTHRTSQTDKTLTPEKLQPSLLPSPLPRQPHRVSHHPRHPSCLTPSKSEHSRRR
jgi:hypothetical protein